MPRREGRFCDPGEDGPSQKNQERFTPRVNTYGAIWENGLMWCTLPSKGSGERGGVTAKDWFPIVKQKLAPYLNSIKKAAKNRPIVFMQDGASIHCPKDVQDWLKSHKIELMEGWPAHSPDLNPIENLWGWAKKTMGKKAQIFVRNDENLAKVAKIRDVVMKTYRSDSRKNLMASFEKRLQKCCLLYTSPSPRDS